ncbi:hypothetical protein AB0L63_25470 [Nocardia sp. NPDC051990]|uniref:hypothetical protein n=1 Tax=Nocardia sp. NPDC051990 TaxID=3155285 RepID=UPI0034473596
MFGLGLKDIISGVATGVGFAFGGPVGGALVGGIVGGGIAMFEGKGWDDVMEATLVNGALGAIPGGVVGGAAKGTLLKGGTKALMESFKDAGTLFLKKGAKAQYGGFAERLAFLRAPMNKMGLGTTTATLASAYGGKAWRDFDQTTQAAPPEPAELPTIIIT